MGAGPPPGAGGGGPPRGGPKFVVFLKDELLKDLEYGGTPKSRALINLNVAFQELKGEPVTTNFGPPRGAAPPPAPGGGPAPTAPPPPSGK